MQALVVYESLWGNTAATAAAIAAGIGSGTRALSTADAVPEAVANLDLLVAGAPVFAFRLSSERVRDEIREHPEPGAPEPDLSGTTLRSWLAHLPDGTAACAAFDTQVRGPFGQGAPTIAKLLRGKGYRLLAPPEGFFVAGKYGPMREGELERAQRWGAFLAEQLRSS